MKIGIINILVLIVSVVSYLLGQEEFAIWIIVIVLCGNQGFIVNKLIELEEELKNNKKILNYEYYR